MKDVELHSARAPLIFFLNTRTTGMVETNAFRVFGGASSRKAVSVKTKQEMEFYINVDFMVNGFCPLEGEELCSGSCPMQDFAMSCGESFFIFPGHRTVVTYEADTKTLHS